MVRPDLKFNRFRGQSPWLALLLIGLCWSPTVGQTLQERIAHTRQARAEETHQAQEREAEAQAALLARLQTVVEKVRIEQVTLDRVMRWYPRTTSVPVVINWRSLEAAGVDRKQPISLAVDSITAGQLLALLMQMMQADEPVVYEITPWYVQLLTRSQALQRPELRIYDVMDLVMAVPDFEAPSFDLSQIVEANADQQALFEEDKLPPADPDDTQQQRGEALAELVAQTIEPDIWQRHGGEFCSIRYRAGMLIVRAPAFVHRQIGEARHNTTTAQPRTRAEPDAAASSANDSVNP